MKAWNVSNVEDASYVGSIEFQDYNEDYYNLEIMITKDESRIVFGGFTNTGFLESGYIEIDPDYSIDENIQEMISDLEVYYMDGPKYTNKIVCNERM